MFAGHYALGLACHASQPSDRRGVLLYFVLGAQLNDILWTLLTLVGVEGGRSMGAMEFHEPFLPWSHALLMHVVYAVVVGVVGGVVFDRVVGVFGAVNIVGHCALDVAVEDMPWSPIDDVARVPGFDLYDRGFVWWFAVEAVFIVVACVYAWRRLDTRVQSPRFVVVTIVALLVLHAALAVPTLLHVPARDLGVEPWAAVGYLLPLIVGVALTTTTWRRALQGSRSST